jgi:membrane-associated phospholipid phosphatase
VNHLPIFLSRRLARDEPRGLPLTLGLTISVLVLVLFLTLAVQVHPGDPEKVTKGTFDWDCAAAMKEHAEAHPALLNVLALITHLGGVPAMVAFSVLGAAALWWRHYRVLAVAWAVAAAGGGLMNMGTKWFIDRERPPRYVLRDPRVPETNKSFPSGHSMGSVIGYGMLGYVVALLVRRRWQRVAAVALLAGLVLLIGFSRIYLRAHWFTDVLGGFAIGTFWVSLCITWAEVTRRRARAAG